MLDVETYYTVAHDILKLGEILMPDDQSRRFRKEPIYKQICRIRSSMVRHAYEKPDGDPYSGFGWSPDTGPRLKLGSPASGFTDPGFFENQQRLVALLDKYRLGRFVLPGHYQHIAGYLRRTLKSADLNGYVVPQIHYSDQIRLGDERLETRGMLPVSEEDWRSAATD
jgi:hypothetical protein